MGVSKEGGIGGVPTARDAFRMSLHQARDTPARARSLGAQNVPQRLEDFRGQRDLGVALHPVKLRHEAVAFGVGAHAIGLKSNVSGDGYQDSRCWCSQGLRRL